MFTLESSGGREQKGSGGGRAMGRCNPMVHSCICRPLGVGIPCAKGERRHEGGVHIDQLLSHLIAVGQGAASNSGSPPPKAASLQLGANASKGTECDLPHARPAVLLGNRARPSSPWHRRAWSWVGHSSLAAASSPICLSGWPSCCYCFAGKGEPWVPPPAEPVCPVAGSGHALS